MKALIYSFSAAGTALGTRVCQWLTETGWQSEQVSLKKFCIRPGLRPFSPDLRGETQRAFQNCRLLVFIGASGIAVRTIAPFIRHKDVDPAVLVLDEGGHFVIPLLSGHIGGANDLARGLAAYLQAQPVITTATDVHGLFAIDEWARKKGLALSSLAGAKRFAAALLEKGKLGFYSEFPLQGSLPNGLYLAEKKDAAAVLTIRNASLYPQALVFVRPAIVHLGIGCRRGSAAGQIKQQLQKLLQQTKISPDSLKDVSSIDVKKNEAGLLAAAKDWQLPLHFYRAADLNAVPGEFSGSAFVKKTVGTDNVCERAAVLASHGGTLIQKKTAAGGVTLALAVEKYIVTF